ncbi:MAG: glycosyltransferase [bacterium]|nr:glycosyltransferase [bacterium]
MKICVYAISKNEEKFVDTWYNSMKEADKIFVLDTGSTDKTVEKLKKLGVNVFVKEYDFFRFDKARNESLQLVDEDTDVCVCTDLDEVFNEGWRKELENVWDKKTNKLRYIYNWKLDENNKPIISFMYEKIHSRANYEWIHPVHEILKFKGKNEVIKTNNSIILNHYPDSTKSRSNYLPLLELSVKENPTNDRNMHYLGREYMYYKQYDKSIDILKKHLTLETATWIDERAASMRFIGRCYYCLSNKHEARYWYNKAIDEAPHLRDGYVELALLEYNENNWNNVYKYCLMALTIQTKELTYINEPFSWDYTIYDLLSLSCFYNNKIKEALLWVELALDIDKNNKRLLNNKEIYINNLKQTNN